MINVFDQCLGPYVNTEHIDDIAFRLDLPPQRLLHRVFYVSLLEPYASYSNPDRVDPPHPPPPIELDEGGENHFQLRNCCYLRLHPRMNDIATPSLYIIRIHTYVCT